MRYRIDEPHDQADLPMYQRAHVQKCDCGNTYVGMPGGRCTACIADDITRSVIAMRETLNGTLANNEGRK